MHGRRPTKGPPKHGRTAQTGPWKRRLPYRRSDSSGGGLEEGWGARAPLISRRAKAVAFSSPPAAAAVTQRSSRIPAASLLRAPPGGHHYYSAFPARPAKANAPGRKDGRKRGRLRGRPFQSAQNEVQRAQPDTRQAASSGGTTIAPPRGHRRPQNDGRPCTGARLKLHTASPMVAALLRSARGPASHAAAAARADAGSAACTLHVARKRGPCEREKKARYKGAAIEDSTRSGSGISSQLNYLTALFCSPSGARHSLQWCHTRTSDDNGGTNRLRVRPKFLIRHDKPPPTCVASTTSSGHA